MKRKVCLFFSVLLLCMSMTIPALAAGDRLVDEADLLSVSEEETLEMQLDEISDRHQLDVVVVTMDDLNGYSATAVADDYYDYNGYRPDGILLLVSMTEREWAISTTGYGITAFTDAGLGYLEDQFLDALSDGEYFDAFDTFAEVCDEMILQAKTGEAYDVGNMPKGPFPFLRNAAISLAIGLIIALIVTGIWRGQLKSVRPQAYASEYVIPGSMHLTNQQDMFLYRNVTRRIIETDSDSGGSSTHISSSGTTHGGSSGKF